MFNTTLETVLLWVLFWLSASAFIAQASARFQLIKQGTGGLDLDGFGRRLRRFIIDVLFQRATIIERPLAGVAHGLVFWGFLAFGGYTLAEFLWGLRIIDMVHTRPFGVYRLGLVPFAVFVLVGIVLLLVRRLLVRPIALGAMVSIESVVIAILIATLMVTFLVTFAVGEASGWGRLNWWTHMLVLLAFMALIPASKHFHLVLSPVTVFLKSRELGLVKNLDFDREEVGLEVLADLSKKTVLDAFTCVECGRCQVNCPAWGRRQSGPTRIAAEPVVGCSLQTRKRNLARASATSGSVS